MIKEKEKRYDIKITLTRTMILKGMSGTAKFAKNAAIDHAGDIHEDPDVRDSLNPKDKWRAEVVKTRMVEI